MSKYKVYQKVLLLLVILSILLSFIAVFFYTDIYYRYPGKSYIMTVNVDRMINGEVGVGYLLLEQHIYSPSAIEMLRFSNNDRYIAFVANPGQRTEEELIINTPNNIFSGKYCYTVVAVIQNNRYPQDYCFRVR